MALENPSFGGAGSAAGAARGVQADGRNRASEGGVGEDGDDGLSPVAGRQARTPPLLRLGPMPGERVPPALGEAGTFDRPGATMGATTVSDDRHFAASNAP